MNIEKSRLISEAAPHLNASLGTINGNEFAAIVPVNADIARRDRFREMMRAPAYQWKKPAPRR